MQLYALAGQSKVVHPDLGDFEPDENGIFELPEEFGAFLHDTWVGGQRAWETPAERQDRLEAEEVGRARDPATLLAAVRALNKA